MGNSNPQTGLCDDSSGGGMGGRWEAGLGGGDIYINTYGWFSVDGVAETKYNMVKQLSPQLKINKF